MPSYLITGASRGLGLGFAAVLLKDPNNTVIATARNPAASQGLQELKAKHSDGRLHLVELDVSNAESVRKAAEETARLLPSGLDNLISNAGPEHPQPKFEDMDLDVLIDEVGFNLKSTIIVVREFLPLIRKSEGKKIGIISSVLGSIEFAGNMVGVANGYSIAKASLNMLVRKWSSYLKSDGITMTIIHPGWSGATQIGNGIADWMAKYAPHVPNLSVEQSAEGTIKVLNSLKPEDNGAFYAYDGNKLPW